MSKVKGTKLTSKIAYLKDKYGESAVTNILKSMTEEDQKALKFVLDISWYPLELYDRLMVAICKVIADGDEAIYDRIGEYSADRALNSQYKGFFRTKEPLKLLENMVPMHALMNDPGHMEVISKDENRCIIKVTQPRSSSINCRIANAFYKRSVKLCGVKEVYVTETKCSARGDDYCEFNISWEL